MKRIIALCGLLAAILLTGCAKKEAVDYTAFRQHPPKSILVLLPQNDSPETNASHGMLSNVTYPLSEAGYYVFPVAMVEEVFKQNGLVNGGEIQTTSLVKLREIFGADSVLYITVKDYGTSYQVIASDTRVTADAKLVDLATGTLLWSGSATASSNEQNSGSGNLIGMLIQAAVNQIAHTLTDKSYEVAGVTSVRLLGAGQPDGILYGPRSPKYGQDAK